MSKKRHKNKNKFNKEKTEMGSLIESDDYFGFIAGYTSNGVPFGLTHDEWDKINADLKNEKSDNENIDLPF